ncbi:MAG: acyl-CoA synthetase [Acidobacteriota bacterium]
MDSDRKITGLDDIRAIEQMAYDEAVPIATTYGAICRSAERNPQGNAITFLPTGAVDEAPIRLTYAELRTRVTQAANLFTELGVGPEDAVSLLLPSLPDTQIALWGAEAAGIANPINFLLRPEQIVGLLNAAESKVLVALGPHPAIDIWSKVEALRDQVPTLRSVLRVGGGPGDDSFASRLERQPGDRLLSGRQIRAQDIAAYFHTGGTTGSPKLACHTHRNEVHCAWSVARMYDLGPSSSLANGLPLFHVAGTIIASLAPIVAASEIVVLSPAGLRSPLVVENYWRLVEKYGLTHIGGVPTSLAALLNVPVGDADLSSAEIAMTGASPLPLDTARRFESHCGVRIHEIYGMTESGGLIAMTPRHCERTLGAVGYRMPFEEVKVTRLAGDGSFSQPAASGEPGVLLVRGPNVFPGYKDSSHDGSALTEEGWLITGDLASLDTEGRIRVTGRAKDLIIRSGHNIDPAWIEEAVESHPDIELCAAIGQPDAYAGEVPAVYATLRPGASVTASELEAYVAERIAEPPARPRHIYLVDELPITAVGKVFKPDLRRDAVRRVVEGELADIAAECGGLDIDVVASPSGGFEARIRFAEPGDVDRESIAERVSDKLQGYLFGYALS